MPELISDDQPDRSDWNAQHAFQLFGTDQDYLLLQCDFRHRASFDAGKPETDQRRFHLIVLPCGP